MAFLFTKSLRIIQMLDPLQLTHAETQDQELEIQIPDRTVPEPSIAGNSKSFLVQCWTVNDVLIWLQQNVHVTAERMEELLSTFESEGIDGSKLLPLQRNSDACSKMSDTEWLLLHEARKNLVTRENEREVGLLSSNKAASLPPSPLGGSSEVGSTNDNNINLTMTQRSLIPSAGSLLSYLKFFSLPTNFWSRTANKQEQKGHATNEVFLLQEEVLSAQEREASLKARMDHLDQVLRTARMSSYLYTRFRWTPLPGELPVDDSDVDDWLQRFLVLGGSTLFFYPEAADFRPQGAIILRDAVDMGYIAGQFVQDGEAVKWFGFQVTTSEGFRLECATPLRLQAELWISLLQGACGLHDAEVVTTERS